MSIIAPSTSTAVGQAARRALSTARRAEGSTAVRPPLLIAPVQLRCSSSSISRRRALRSTGTEHTTAIVHTDLGSSWRCHDQQIAGHERSGAANEWVEQSPYEFKLRGSRLLSPSFFSPSQFPHQPTIQIPPDCPARAEASSTGLARVQQEQIVQALLGYRCNENSFAAAVESFQSTLPHATADEAALMLASHVARHLPIASDWTDDQTGLVASLYQRSTGCRTQAEEPRTRASRALFTLCRGFLRSNRPQHLSYAARMLTDRRLKGSQVRWLLRRATWPLRNIAKDLNRTGSTVDDKRRASVLLEQWNTSIQSTLRDGKLGMFKEGVSKSSHTGAFVPTALSYFAVLLAEYGSGTALLALTAALRDYAFHCQYTASVLAGPRRPQTESFRAPTGFYRLRSPAPLSVDAEEIEVPSQPFLPFQAVELILHHLMSRGQFRQAADFLDVMPSVGRSLRCYQILLERFGEGEAVGSGRKLCPSPRVGSLPFHNKIWQETLELAAAHGASSDAWMRLYEARMRSHSLTGSVSLVFHDLKTLRRHGAFRLDRTRSTSLSIFRHPAQIAVVKTFLRKGLWLGAKSLAEKLIRDFRHKQRLAGKSSNGHFETALLNTLLRGLIDITRYSTASSSSQGFLTSEQVEGFLSEMDDLQSRLAIASDLVTRNIILLALLRWDQVGLDILGELLTRCGIFVGECSDFKIKGDGSSLSVPDLSSALPPPIGVDAKHFLRFDASLLRALSRSFFEKNMPVEGRCLVSILKEAEKIAKARLQPKERVWKKSRARLQSVLI